VIVRSAIDCVIESVATFPGLASTYKTPARAFISTSHPKTAGNIKPPATILTKRASRAD